MDLLKDFDIQEEVINQITFPNGSPYCWKKTTEFIWSVDKTNIFSSIREILTKVPYLRNHPDAVPMTGCRLAAAYEVAYRSYMESTEQRCDAADDPEKALHEKIVERQEVEFRKAYNFKPLGWIRPGEKTKARIFRWLQPSGRKEVLPMELMKCHERPTKVSEDKLKASMPGNTGIAILVDHNNDKPEKIVTEWDYYNKMKTWAYAMAWAGTDMVSGPWGEVRRCPLDVFINYAEEAYRRAIRTPEPLKWLRERDEKTRAKMIEHMLDTDGPLPAGKALDKAFKEDLHNLWDIEKVIAKVSDSAAPTLPSLSAAHLKDVLQQMGFTATPTHQPRPRTPGKWSKQQLKNWRKRRAAAAANPPPPPPPPHNGGRGGKDGGKGKGKWRSQPRPKVRGDPKGKGKRIGK